MALRTDQNSREAESSSSTRAIVVLWFVSLFVCTPLFDWDDTLLLLFAMTIVPIVTIGAWLIWVPIWLLWLTFVRLYRRRWYDAFCYVSVLPIGVVVAFAGLKLGDFIAIKRYGSELERAVSAVDKGASPVNSNGLFSSSIMAFRLTGGFLDISEGILYDSTGEAGRMLALPPRSRPIDWQKHAVDVMSCQGRARHLFGDFYRVSVSSYNC